MSEEIELYAKIFGAVMTALIIPYSKKEDSLFGKPITRKKSKEADDYEFISSFLAGGIEGRSNLSVEQAFMTYFKRKYYYYEIVAALKFTSPVKAFDLLYVARKGVVVSGDEKFIYKDEYSTSKKRNAFKALYLFLYTFGMVMALLPVYYAGELIASWGWKGYIPVILWLVTFVCWAFSMLEEGTSINSAERLIKEQSTYFKKQS